MQMPNYGESVEVCPTEPNIPTAPGGRQFYAPGKWAPAVVTDHVVRRILDGSLAWRYLAPASAPVASEG